MTGPQEHADESVWLDTAPPVRSVRDYLGHSPRAEKDSRTGAKSSVLPEPYLIGVGDVLSIMVWNHPGLSAACKGDGANPGMRFPVDNDGYVFFPFAGRLKAEGKTTETVRQEVTHRLKPVVKTPQISVNVEVYGSRRVYVVGEVERPGMIPVTGRPLTVLEALARVGGVKQTASLGPVEITGPSGNRTVDLRGLLREGDMAQDIVLHAGDVLRVPDNRREKVFVLGEVRQPQSVNMIDGSTTLAEALTEAGGPNQSTADAANIYVLRGDARKPNIFHLDMEQADALLLADRFSLEPRDIVFVSAAPVTRWNRVLNQILPSLQTIFYIDGLAR